MVEKLKMKNQEPNKRKYSNKRREKMKITSKEVIAHIFQLLNWLVIRITIIKRLLKKKNVRERDTDGK